MRGDWCRNPGGADVNAADCDHVSSISPGRWHVTLGRRQMPPAFSWIKIAGVVITIRPIRPDDRGRLQTFVRNLSFRSRYLRFLSPLKELPPLWLDKLTDVRFPEEMASIATIATESGARPIGVARYASTGTDNAADIGISVADDWQGKGLGRELLSRIVEIAERAGIKQLKSVVLRDNANTLRLAKYFGFAVSRCPYDARLVQISKQLRNSDCEHTGGI